MNANQIAIQMYTLREESAKDLVGTLGKLAGVGYTAVEFAGFHGVPVPDLRSALDANGMNAMGAHVGYDLFDQDPGAVFADLITLGCEYAIVPWLRPEQRSAENVPALAESFNRWAALAQAEGIRFAYHNHDFEFTAAPDGMGEPGDTLFDVLAARTDPNLVGFELDAYWVRYAVMDPVSVLRRHAGRIPLLHVKEMSDRPDRSDAPFGEGIMPWDAIFPVAAETGVAWFIVEQDTPQDAYADVGLSLKNLQARVSE